MYTVQKCQLRENWTLPAVLIKIHFAVSAFTQAGQHDTSRHTQADNLVSKYTQGSFLRSNTKISHLHELRQKIRLQICRERSHKTT